MISKGVSKAEKKGGVSSGKNKSKVGDNVSEQYTLEVKKRGNKMLRLEFESDEDRRGWERAYRKSRFYTLYFMVGVGINFLLYYAGLDLSRNILLGAAMGLAVPLTSMFTLTELHFYLLNKKRNS